ncbi:MAG: DUF262 domain-containing protein [Alphaproteobacteria bacterium GM202ARS2]|nr:DUF262 domain-containing protein [Alphaproteobacteria bacterium GM202ARS2]
MARITNHKYTIEDAFKECFYVVPDYQREYIWADKQVNRLLEDIDEQIDNNSSEYFIGTVLVSPRDTKGHFDVIDGQQRLTTAFLILCALRVFFRGKPQGESIKNLIESSYTTRQGDTKTNLKLDPRYENSGEVMRKLVEVNDTPEAVKASIQSSGIQIYGSIKNILDAYDTIYHFLTENYDDEDSLKKYWGRLTNDVVFIQISTDVSSALKIFETINERGIGLNSMDLLKNLLFTRVSPKEFSRLKNEWKKITNPLEKNKEKPLRFLRYFLMANYDVKKKSNLAISEDEIYGWFTQEKNIKATGYQKDPFAFVFQLTSNVDQYINFVKKLGNDGDSSPAMASLKSLTGGSFSLHYVLLLAAARLPKSLFDQFVVQLENFLFYYIFTKTQAKELERLFLIWVVEIRSIAHIENPKEQREKLNRFVAECFAKNMAKKAQELEDALKRLSLLSMQQYRIRYFLARVTQHVDMAFKGIKTGDSLELYLKLQIEHILPNNPKEDLQKRWQDYDEIKNRLGNLTLLEAPINNFIGNDFYSKKVPHYAKSGNYLTRSLSKLDDVGKNNAIARINKKLSSFETWDNDAIDKRQLLLIALAKDIWKTTEITA